MGKSNQKTKRRRKMSPAQAEIRRHARRVRAALRAEVDRLVEREADDEIRRAI